VWKGNCELSDKVVTAEERKKGMRSAISGGNSRGSIRAGNKESLKIKKFKGKGEKEGSYSRPILKLTPKEEERKQVLEDSRKSVEGGSFLVRDKTSNSKETD